MYHELAYLHPNHFTPDPKIVEAYGIDTSKPYFVMRFASLNAHHDSGIKGINTEIAQRLIDILEGSGLDHFESPNPTASPTGLDHFESDPSQLVPFSSNSSPNNSTKGTSLTPSEACSLSADSGNKPRIYITSERPLEPQFEKYRIKINSLDMHHVMAFASLYIGDSQTMAAEAGVVGTPFVRLNDFVGRLSYLHELEAPTDYTPRSDGYVPRVDAHVPDDVHYSLGYGHKTADVEGFFASIQRWLDTPDRKAICAERRAKMLSEKVDYAKFLTWFIEEWPKSGEAMKAAPKDAGSEFWKRFK